MARPLLYAALWLLPVAALAQADMQTQTIEVTGQRASLATAASLKREAPGLVDSVVAEDVHKLPDFSIADALQRITGVQITRDRGEAALVLVRGLAQIETLLNGREVFTAGTGRQLDFADIPAEMVARIDVHKSGAADQVEGGAAGIIDLRMRRPFDFPGRTVVATARAVHGSLVRRTEPQLSVLWSERGSTAASGEWGLLVNLAWQRRAWREDQKGSGNPLRRSDLMPGQEVVVPNGTSESASAGRRERRAGSLVAQWRPRATLQAYAEAHLAEFKTLQDTHQINVFAPTAAGSFDPASLRLFPGTQDVQHITWLDAPVSALSFARDTVDRTRQFALGGSWRPAGDWEVELDASTTRATNDFYFAGPFMATTAPRFTHDLSTRVPGTRVQGVDLLDPQAYRFTGVAYRTRPFEGELHALRLDARRSFAEGWLRSVRGGLRMAKRHADNVPGLVFADAPVTGLAPADVPGSTIPNPYADFMSQSGAGSSLGQHLAGSLHDARDAAALRAAFGIDAPVPAAANPLTLWQIDERSDAAYLSAAWEAPALPLDGEAGVRVVRSCARSSSHQTGSDGVVAPTVQRRCSTDALPSASLRWRLPAGLQLRAAASRTLTRPGFDQQSPSLSLVRNPINPSQNTGSAGNPGLKPLRSDNLDLALERYAGRHTMFHLTAFYKRVDGFVVNLSQPETHFGETYQVSRPRNAGRGSIRGIEIGGQHFFTALPGAWSGLGVLANATYVDSRHDSFIVGQQTPLPNLSRKSANLILLYEHQGVTGRLAYNWRDRFLNGFINIVGIGPIPAHTRGYGWLDASLSWRPHPQVSVSLEGLNLLRTVRSSYYGAQTRPQSSWRNDTQWSTTVTLQF
jgi:TonB-dependent receptor